MQTRRNMTTPMQTQPQTPLSGLPKPRHRSGRTPLQPKNSPADPRPKPKPKPRPDVEQHFEITPTRDSDDKENRPIAAAADPPPAPPQLPDASSLAEELSAIKKKLERLRLDRENTEKTLNEKDAKLDAMMMELEDRGEVQKKLEIEVDRLFRLKELKYRCMRVSPMRTLRAKEQGKIINEAPSSSQSEVKTEETVSFGCESDGEVCQVHPGSACSQTDDTHER